MPRIDNVKEFTNMTKKFFVDFLGNLNKEISNIISDDNTDSDMMKRYEYYKKEKKRDINNESGEYLEPNEESNCDVSTTFTRKKNVSDDKNLLNLEFTEENLMQAMVYTEIFGKPKARRRRR